ncbi:DUF397 domain-containing protein [Streptomyces sp. NBC_00285]|uniref:DUF397 domain-containing protein n=1 Tax=Streptomyces sp. NBC_00285 TaxID=2975700 RepID=UPI002E2D5282|nr:DUF397 domain-containing protein [Streptomyces sp. NBC_00285]
MQILHWQKSSYSGDSSNCLEIAETPAFIHIRDSKIAVGPQLAFQPSVWRLFIFHATADRRPHQPAAGQPSLGA